MKTIEMQGIVLKQYPLFEKDKCIELYSPEQGKVKLLAKYSCGSSRFGGKLEPSNTIKCQVYKGRGFDTITQCDLIRHFPNVRQTLKSITFCLYCLDTIRKITPYHHANPDLYECLESTLQILNETPAEPHLAKDHFQNTLLIAEGLQADTMFHHSKPDFKKVIENYAERKIETIPY